MKQINHTAKKVLALVLLASFLLVGAPALAATKPALVNTAAINVTQTAARIQTVLKNPSKYKLTECGFTLWRINEKGNIVEKKSGTEKPNQTATEIGIYYDTAKHYGALKENSSYAFEIYAKTAGGNLTTKGSFKTPGKFSLNPKSVTNLMDTSAQINVGVVNPQGQKITKAGFSLWPTNRPSEKKGTTETLNLTIKAFDVFYPVEKYCGALMPDTPYSYEIWVSAAATTLTVSGKFTTPKKSQATVLQSPLDCANIYATTYYGGHSGCNHAALDLWNGSIGNAGNGTATLGIKIRPVAAGVVTKVDQSQGMVIIEHTTPLTTTNGITYKKWYSQYAHMSGISGKATNLTIKNGAKVTTGTILGYACNVGMAQGYHLHFTMNKVNIWGNNEEKHCISPYYVKFNKPVTYRKDAAMMDKVINNKPTP